MVIADYKPYGKGSIGTELTWFFLRENATRLESGEYEARTLEDFLDSRPRHLDNKIPDLGLIARVYCQKLINDGVLFSVGTNKDQKPPYNERFFSYFFTEESADYGTYDFSALGLSEVRRRFRKSVIKLIVQSEASSPAESEVSNNRYCCCGHICGCETIQAEESDEQSTPNEPIWLQTTGTGFLVKENMMATAAHCLEPGSLVTIDRWNAEKYPIKRICMFARDSLNSMKQERSLVDLAIIEFERDPFPRRQKFKLWGSGILSECLVMGYPSIMGFNSELISSAGQIVGEHQSYIRRQKMMIVDARVKGGNSGGPVINRLGEVTGVITNSADGDDDLDQLGYGLATPAQTLLDLINAVELVEERFRRDLFEIKFEIKFEMESQNTIRIRE